MHSVLRQVAQQTGHSLEELYEMIGWPLYKKFKIEQEDENKKAEYMHCYDVMKMGITDPTVFDDLKLEDELCASLMLNIKRRLTPQPLKIRSDVEV